jgi:hypothetical protein
MYNVCHLGIITDNLKQGQLILIEDYKGKGYEKLVKTVTCQTSSAAYSIHITTVYHKIPDPTTRDTFTEEQLKDTVTRYGTWDEDRDREDIVVSFYVTVSDDIKQDGWHTFTTRVGQHPVRFIIPV